MSLTVEDGNIIADADSYVTVAELQSFCTKRGLSLPEEDADIEKLIIKAMDYIESLECDFQGWRVSSSQSLSFPRESVCINGYENAATNIPKNLKSALCRLAHDVQSVDLQPTGDGKEIKVSGIGPLRKEFFRKGTGVSEPVLTAFNALIKPLFKSTAGSAFLEVCRG